MIFDNPEIRQVFRDLHGTDLPQAKFRIGQIVRFAHKLDDIAQEWIGKVEAVNYTGNRFGFEYLIENAPVLAWENQLTAA